MKCNIEKKVKNIIIRFWHKRRQCFPVKKLKVPVKKMRKGVREKTEVPVKILVNSTRETKILTRENF